MTKIILYVNPASEISGAEISLLLLIEALDRHQYQPILIVPAEGSLSTKAKSLNICTKVLSIHPFMLERDIKESVQDAFFSLRELAKIQALLEEIKPDLIHINSYRIGLPFTLVAWKLKIPQIWHIRDIPNSKLKRLFVGMLTRLPNKIISISDAVANALGIKEQPNTTVIYNGLSLEQFGHLSNSNFRNEYKIKNETFLIGIIGQLVPRKGHTLLLEAIAHLKQTRPMIHVVIIGGEAVSIGTATKLNQAYPAYLKDRVIDYELTEQVTFTGHLNDISPILSELDLLVHAAVEPEPFGRVLIEAMAAGKPVLAPNSGGIPEIIQHRVSGLLFESGNSKELTDYIKFAIDNPETLRKIADTGKLVALQKFGIDKHVASIQSLYCQILKEQ